MRDATQRENTHARLSAPQKGLLLCAFLFASIVPWIYSQLFPWEKGRSRLDGELVAVVAAIEDYIAENGRAPSDALTTDLLRSAVSFDPDQYTSASQLLYKALSGDSDGDPTTASPNDTKMYFEFRKDMLRPSPPGPGTYIVDPFGNSYGYSTFKARNPESPDGYNTRYDLWSTNGGKAERDRKKWRTNW